METVEVVDRRFQRSILINSRYASIVVVDPSALDGSPSVDRFSNCDNLLAEITTVFEFGLMESAIFPTYASREDIACTPVE